MVLLAALATRLLSRRTGGAAAWRGQAGPAGTHRDSPGPAGTRWDPPVPPTRLFTGTRRVVARPPLPSRRAFPQHRSVVGCAKRAKLCQAMPNCAEPCQPHWAVPGHAGYAKLCWLCHAELCHAMPAVLCHASCAQPCWLCPAVLSSAKPCQLCQSVPCWLCSPQHWCYL